MSNRPILSLKKTDAVKDVALESVGQCAENKRTTYRDIQIIVPKLCENFLIVAIQDQ